MIALISLLSIVILLLVFFKFEWGVGLFVLYCLMVPTFGLNFGASFVIGRNMFSLFLLIYLMVWANKKGGIKRRAISLMSPFFMLFIVQFFLILFHLDKMPLIEQLDNFRLDIFGLFLPFTIIGVAYVSENKGEVFNIILYVAILISSSYTLFLITRLGQNPYIDAITPLLNDYNMMNQDRILEEGIRRFGYISSVYPYVTEYGDFLIFSTVFLLYRIGRDQTLIPKLLLGLVTICVLVCGSRSVLLGYAVVIFLYLLSHRHFYVLAIAILLFGISAILIVHFFPEYVLYVQSINDDTITGGSSIDMRLSQLGGCFDAINNNPLFGNGYGWAGWYRTNVGRHPVMLSFESILIQVLCDNGIVGVILYTVVTIFIINGVRKSFPKSVEIRHSVVLLLLGFYSYAFFTGDYGMMKVMMWFYAILIANALQERDSLLNQKMDDLRISQ